MIGDPSGKSEERNLQSKETLDANVRGLRSQMERFLDFSGSAAAIIVNNLDWTGPWSYLEFFARRGQNFPVSVMLSKDSVKSRIEREGWASATPISVTCCCRRMTLCTSRERMAANCKLAAAISGVTSRQVSI